MNIDHTVQLSSLNSDPVDDTKSFTIKKWTPLLEVPWWVIAVVGGTILIGAITVIYEVT